MPPYFALDERSLFTCFDAAARACFPLPFFVYEFADMRLLDGEERAGLESAVTELIAVAARERRP